MRSFKLAALIGLLAGLRLFGTVEAGETRAPCHHCQSVDGCCYHDVVRYRCVMVPDKKQIKKTVFDCQEIPYCEHRLPKFGHCDCCPECKACPKFKKVLIKKEVVVGEVCGTKCVIEEYCERVLGPCCHCGQVPGAPSVPLEGLAPEVPTPPTPPAEPKSAWLPPEPVIVSPGMKR